MLDRPDDTGGLLVFFLSLCYFIGYRGFKLVLK
jgi:hypothetical protein